MKPLWFRLPGPSRFLNNVFSELSGGINVLLLAPKEAAGPICDALNELVVDRGHFAPSIFIDATVEHHEIDKLLLDCLPEPSDQDLDAPDTVELLFRHLSDHLFLIMTSGEDANRWIDFLGQHYLLRIRGRKPGQSPIFFIVATTNDWQRTSSGGVAYMGQPPREISGDVAFRCHTWDGVIHRSDVEAYVISQLVDNTEEDEEWYKELQAAMVSCIAGDHIELIEYLTTLRWSLLELPETALYSSKIMLRDGLINDSGDYDEEVWQRRIWRAQVREVFPIIEEMRIHIIRTAIQNGCLADQLFTKVGTQKQAVADAMELDFGDLPKNMMKEANRELFHKASLLRKIRHDIAHLKPVRMDKLDQDLFRKMLKEIRS